ncbi:TonB-dependent receptor [Bowmanella yangjiangensis]|uniref:TonB-dependent receptor n=1 Tax=Bowmanella yangjiangensis TaxID=2811230 RepID=A0ABS3CX49_9ALTE|nr:TonB-dependent receptor [Bowmanella yangjiangensis]MBN7820711.1 TonB-dependent receptor [Bowmanella yangjiangensis]
MKTRYNKLALALATLLGTALPTAAQQADSQEQEETQARGQDVEKIQVRGLRSSISESLFQKQNADSVVDLIIADDIGKFPDENLAEALQRIPGITITRNGGEGQNILVRGLGDGYNITTLNGRKLASDNAGRDFNYDTIASELVNVLEVYKSPEARLIEGGIGAIVNIQTRKPLDLEGFTLRASTKGIYESRTEDINPHGSFIIGDKNQDETFGILFSGAYSKKTLREDEYSAGGFFDPDEGWDEDSAGVPVDVNGNGVIDDNETFASKIPSYMYFTNAQDTRERLGATLAIQWRPGDEWDINFDALYSRYNTDGHRYQIGFVNYDESWTPGTPVFTDASFDDQGRVVAMTQTGNTMVELLNLTEPRKTDTYQLAFNSKWQASDALTVVADIATSKAKNENAGDNRFVVARGFIDSIRIDHDTGNMLPDVSLSPGLTADQPYGAHYSRNTGVGVEDKIDDAKLFAEYRLDDSIINRIEFGASYLKQSKTRDEYSSRNPSMFSRGGFYLNRDGYAFDNSSVFTTGDFELFRIPQSVFRPANFDNFLDGEKSKTPDPWPSFDYDALLDFYRGINADAANDYIIASKSKAGSYTIEEEVKTAYVQVFLEDELFELPYKLNLGLRASQTQTHSIGSVYRLDLIELDEQGKPLNNGWDTPVDVNYSADYSNVLPSMNFKLSLTDELLFRVSAAQVISRPSLNDLRPWRSVNFTSLENGLPTINMGDPASTPEEANQADLTLEWYFGDSSALSGGIFVKDIQSFLEDQKAPIEVDGISYYGNRPVKSQYGASIKGVELSYQQSLEEWLPEPFNGLGMQFNYTYVDSSYDDPARKEQGLPFRGMSKNSYNAVLYYEQYGVQARIAYNWRSKYMNEPEAWGGPEWISDYGQWDASFSYDFNDNFSVFAEASNLTNERYWAYTKVEDQISYLSRFGRQIAVGVRASF